LAHAGSAAQDSSEAVERRLVVGREARRQRHVGRGDAVDHGPAHRLRKLAQHLERDPGAVRAADQVDALGAELAPHRIEIRHRDRRREEAEVASAFSHGCFSSAALHCAIRRCCRSGSACSARVSSSGPCRQRRRAAGAALVDEDDVAPVVEPREQRHHLRRERDRALPGPPARKNTGSGACAAPAPGRRRSGSPMLPRPALRDRAAA
jgi:hypothetical protein